MSRGSLSDANIVATAWRVSDMLAESHGTLSVLTMMGVSLAGAEAILSCRSARLPTAGM